MPGIRKNIPRLVSNSLRNSPTQEFEKYVLTRTVDQSIGLSKVPIGKFEKFDGLISSSGATSLQSETIQLGFLFQFNNRTYDRFVVSTNGWMILRDKDDADEFSLIDYFNEPDSWDEGQSSWLMKPRESFLKPGVLLCPWFDYLKNTYDDIETFTDDVFTGNDEVLDLVAKNNYLNKVKSGEFLPSPIYNPYNSAIKYSKSYIQGEGKCLIVRWRSFSASFFKDKTKFLSTVLSNVDFSIQFEVLIFESGKIQFKYNNFSAHLREDALVDEDGAICGIFINNTPVTGWRFRDFSLGMGHPGDETRSSTKFGGYEYNTVYVDESAYGITPFNHTLFITGINKNSISAYTPDSLKKRVSNWPAVNGNGCVITFSPPLNRRRILPRNEIRRIDTLPTYPKTLRTGDTLKHNHKNDMFDDRNTLIYGNSIIEYPTLLHRGYANTAVGAVERQNLFGDFEVDAQIVKSASEEFIGQRPENYISPFHDHGRPEQMPGQNLEYYSTGSSLELFGNSLQSSLKSKTQLKLELPLDYQTQLYQTNSAIYYYNKKTKGMFIPQNGKAISDIGNAKRAIGLPNSIGYFWPEDARGFGPIGNVVASGSNTQSIYPGWSTDPNFGSSSDSWNLTSSISVLSKQYNKSVQINPDYNASNHELIDIPINHPFVLEKAVFEIPIKAGRDWFLDRTTSSTPIGKSGNTTDQGSLSRVFDFAGPALTISLFNQIINGNTVHRDLILTGTIIPAGDNTGNIAIRQTWYKSTTAPFNFFQYHLFEPEGFLKYSSCPSAVIDPDNNQQFTGSVIVPTQSAVSNGVILRTRIGTATNPAIENSSEEFSKAVKDLMTSPTVDLYSKKNDNWGISTNVKSVNPFGRDSRGNNASGRSIFGKEFITFQQNNNEKFSNPLFVNESFEKFPPALKSIIDTSINTNFSATFQFAVPIENSIPSPYLLMPGDKLIFALSKNRPALHTNGTVPLTGEDIDYWRHGLRHDIGINTGSIKITLYGSLLREDKEFHDPLSQDLHSNAVHETIGMDPVLDQFQVEYRDSFYGSYTDDFITGSIFPQTLSTKVRLLNSKFTSSNTYTFSSTRGKVFSKTNSSLASPINQNNTYELLTNARKSLTLQPWSEKVGVQNILKISSNTERFYDTLLPDFTKCILRNNKKLSTITDVADIIKFMSYDRDKKYGLLFLNSDNTVPQEINDEKWNFSFPFEPKYTQIERKFLFESEWSTKCSFDIATSATSDSVTPRKFNNFLVCEKSENKISVLCDVDFTKINERIIPTPASSYITSSLTPNDMAKSLFGFGDVNTIQINSNVRTGYHHKPSFRDTDKTTLGSNEVTYQFSPVIRGWKYGLLSGTPMYSSAVFRRDRFGQFRDMLEQRLDSKFCIETTMNIGRGSYTSSNLFIDSSPVNVRFINPVSDDITAPELTLSNNLSFEATSSLPYFDEDINNRTPILNQSMIQLIY